MATERPPTRTTPSAQHAAPKVTRIHEATMAKSGIPECAVYERKYVNDRKKDGYEVEENDFEYIFRCPESDFQARQKAYRDKGEAQTNPGGRTNVNPSGGERTFGYSERAQMTPQQLLRDPGIDSMGDTLVSDPTLAPEAE